MCFPPEATYPGIDKTHGAEIVIWGNKEEESGIRGDTDAERIANAHLIACAPELFSTLEMVLEHFKGLSHTDRSLQRVVEKVINKALNK